MQVKQRSPQQSDYAAVWRRKLVYAALAWSDNTPIGQMDNYLSNLYAAEIDAAMRFTPVEASISIVADLAKMALPWILQVQQEVRVSWVIGNVITCLISRLQGTTKPGPWLCTASVSLVGMV